MNRKDYRPPPRKEPGIIGRLISFWVKCISWLLLSVMLSILIEWTGMATVWKEEGAYHSQRVLAEDQKYLNEHLLTRSGAIKTFINTKFQNAITFLNSVNWRTLFHQPGNTNDTEKKFTSWKIWLSELRIKFEPYIQAALTVSQISIVRLVLIIFSLPVFGLLVLVGAIDGLVERDLRRWGGGRESSNVYNLARRSVFPSFIAVCVIYISLPFSINPTLVILPFALMMGLSTRIMFERLKKYF